MLVSTDNDLARALLSSQKVQIPQLFETLKGCFFDLAKSKRIHLAFQVQPGIDGMEADPAFLRLILLNLIGIAISFNQEYGEVNVRLYKSVGEEWVICEVLATWGMVAEDYTSHLISCFLKELEENDLGVGLSRYLAELHGGDLHIEYLEGQSLAYIFKNTR